MDRSGAHDPRAIANRILDIMSRDERPVTLMQLIKLVYIADGWSLALLGRPLSKLPPQAWQYGPVFPTVYKSFKQFGSRPINEPASDRSTGIAIAEDFDVEEAALLRQVVKSYGKYHAFRLSEMMHQPGTPWTITFNKSGAYAEIPLELITEHFKKLRLERGVSN